MTAYHHGSGQTRMTQQRAVILEELRRMKTHPTADELYQCVRARLPRISLGTVYRNLVFLTGSGQVLRVDGAGGANRFDANVAPHRHARCVLCGRVVDVPIPADEGLEARLAVPGFSRILETRVEYEGVCEACALAEAIEGKPGADGRDELSPGRL